MKPGIDLDIRIAEKVMGLKVIGTVFNKGKRTLYTIGEPSWFDIQGDMQLSNPIPDYSTDIAAAWEVVEEMRSKDWAFILDNIKDFLGNWQAHFEYERRSFTAEARTAPYAICLAALMAVGHKC